MSREQQRTSRTSSKGTPPTNGSRIVGLDVARAVAICLMILENFKVLMLGTEQEHHLLVWLAGLTDGRSAPLFVTLAGVGVSLFTAKARREKDLDVLGQARWILLKRSLFFLAAGNLFILIWFMDILHFYALYIALAALLLLTSPTRRLLWYALGLTAFSAIVLYGRGEALFEHYEYWTAIGVLRDTFFDGIHPVFPWFVFVIVGVWIGRLDLGDATLRRRLLAGALAFAVGIELVSDILKQLAFVHEFPVVPATFPQLIDTRLTPPGPLYVLSASATSVVGIAGCLILADRWRRSAAIRALSAAGQLSFTLYIAHAVVGAGLLWLAGNLEDRSIDFAVGYWAAYTLLSITAADLYRRRFTLGPLEWLLRRSSGGMARKSAAERGKNEGKAKSSDRVRRGETSRKRNHQGWEPVAWIFGVIGTLWLVYFNIYGLLPPGECPDLSGPLRPGATVSGELSITCRERWLDVEIPAGLNEASLTIEVLAGSDTYLELWDEAITRVIAEDDDSGPGYCPRLEVGDLNGRYRLLIRPYRSETGPFMVGLRERAPY